MDKGTALPSNPGTNCQYYLEKKKRFCRLERMKGSDFCVQHILISPIENKEHGNPSSVRIKCPLDPSHTCDVRNLSKHIKKCNITKLIPEDSWYVPGINSGKERCMGTAVSSLRDVSVEDCKALIERLKNLSPIHPQRCKDPLLHKALSSELWEMKESSEATKKVVQNSSLLAMLEKNALLISPSNYVEFGAGRGQLTTSIIKALDTSGLSSSGFVLVDRGTNRRKLDAKYRQTGKTTIERIRCDIKDLCLKEIGLVKKAESKKIPLVAVSKHLCGSATDLTLRCVLTSPSDPGCVGGVIALCCHHRCGWQEYVGKRYFESAGLSEKDFSIMSLMSSWAVCCFRDKGSTNNRLDFINDEEKESIGILCKNLIDCGRSDFLSKHGFRSYLAEYTSKSVTLENVALVFNRESEKS